ncbi:MAG: hypothetical protein WA667_22950 [Candidatus Nitrosopolaris sp.]
MSYRVATTKNAIIFLSVSSILLFLGINPVLLEYQAYAEQSLTMTTPQCEFFPGFVGVGFLVVVSGVSHDSDALLYPLDIFAPNGNLSTNFIVTIPSDAPDQATTEITSGAPFSPGTFKLIVIPNGQILSKTFNAPDCSRSHPATLITSAVDGNGVTLQNGTGTTLSTSVKFTFTGSGVNSIASFECSLDGNPFSTCATMNPGTVSYNNLVAGQQHTFAVRAVDTQGIIDPHPVTFSWTILTPAQATHATITPAQLHVGTNTQQKQWCKTAGGTSPISGSCTAASTDSLLPLPMP